MPFSFGRRARRSSRGKSDFQVKSSGGGKEAFFRFHSFYYVNTLAYIFMEGSCTYYLIESNYVKGDRLVQ